MLFIGHTRFSLFQPDSAAWKATNGSRFRTHSEYKNHLFSEERLAPRTKVFIEESLPQIAAGVGDHDVVHVVSYSRDLPDHHRKRLVQAADTYPFLILDEHSGNQSSHPLSEVTMDAVSTSRPPGGVFGRYRLDDDDLLAANYFDQTAPFLTPEHVGWIVSLGSGVTGIRMGDGYYNLRSCHFPMLALGLLSVCKRTTSGKVIAPRSISHARSDRANPVILDSRAPAYFWGRHPHQDTALASSSLTESEVITKLRKSVDRYPELPADFDLIKHFPAVHMKMHRSPGPSNQRQDLLSSSLTLTDDTSHLLPLPSVRGTLTVEVSLASSGTPSPRSALISLQLISTAGTELPEAAAKQLRQQGVYKSKNPSIGYFKYLSTQDGESVETHNFDLPEGVECRGIALRRHGSGQGNVVAEAAAASWQA